MSVRHPSVSPRQERLRFGPPTQPARRPSRPAARPQRDTGCDATTTELARPRALAREDRTLEDVISGAWEDLSVRTTTACPVCDHEALSLTVAAGSAVVAACRNCGTQLR